MMPVESRTHWILMSGWSWLNPSAYAFAYALTRSCMPAKGLFKMIAVVPILVPSLLPGRGLIYCLQRLACGRGRGLGSR